MEISGKVAIITGASGLTVRSANLGGQVVAGFKSLIDGTAVVEPEVGGIQ